MLIYIIDRLNGDDSILKYLDFYHKAKNMNYKLIKINTDDINPELNLFFSDKKTQYKDLIEVERILTKKLEIKNIIIDPVSRSINRFLFPQLPYSIKENQIEMITSKVSEKVMNPIDRELQEITKICFYSLEEITEKNIIETLNLIDHRNLTTEVDEHEDLKIDMDA